MRIAIITANFPTEPIDGMFLTMSLEIALGLKRQGHELLIVALSDDREGEDQVAGLRVFRVKPYSENFDGLSIIPSLRLVAYWFHCALATFAAAKQVVDDFNPDVIECQDFFGLGLPWVSDRKYPVLIRLIGSLAEMMRNGSVPASQMDIQLANSMEIANVGGAMMALSLCQDLCDRLIKSIGLPPEHFKVIRTPLTVPQDIPERTVEADAPFPNILFWGRIDSQKGCDLIIEALPRVLEKYPNACVTMVGREVYPVYAQNLRLRLEELQIADRFKFTGELPRADIVKLAVDSDLCVFPSRYETACYACLEAMTYGSCVIATAVGGLAEYVEHENTGWLIPPESPEALAEAILHLSENPELRQSLTQNAKEMIPVICDPDTACSATIAAYEQAISSFVEVHNAGTFLPVVQCLIEALRDRSVHQFVDQLQKDVAANAVSVIQPAAFKEGYNAGFQAAREQALGVGSELHATRAELSLALEEFGRLQQEMGDALTQMEEERNSTELNKAGKGRTPSIMRWLQQSVSMVTR